MAAMADKVKAVISRNTSFAFGRQFLAGVVFLLVTPYAVSKLGIERYGVWALTSAMLGYAALGDFGVRTAFKKFVAQHNAAGAKDAIIRIVGDGLVFCSILGMLPALLALAFGEPVLSALNVSAEILPEAASLLLLMAIVFFLDNLSNVFCGVVEGMQRMEVSSCIYVGQSVTLGLGIGVALASGGGLVQMGLAAVVASTLAAGAYFVAARRVTNLSLFPWRLKLSWPVFRELLTYGIKLQGSAIAMVGNLHLDKLLLARFWGLEFVAIYEIALRTALVFRQVPALMVSAFVPAVADLSARGEVYLLRKIYERGVRYVAVAGVPMAVMALIYADELLAAWIGSSAFTRASGILRLLAVAHCTAILIDAPFATARGLGILRYELTTGIAHPIAHLALGLLLIPALGLWGAAIAHAAVVISVAVGAGYWTHRGLGLSGEPFLSFYGRMLKGPVRAAAIATAAALPVYLLMSSFTRFFGDPSAGAAVATGRLGPALILCVSGGVFGLVYVAASLRTGVVSARDMDAVPVLGRILASRSGRRALGSARAGLSAGPGEATS